MKHTEKNDIKHIVDIMDEDAENLNAHEFVIMHRALAVLAAQTIGETATLKLMLALKREGGLHSLIGSYERRPQSGTILGRLGVSENWGEWKMPAMPNPMMSHEAKTTPPSKTNP